jgi:hypothetical protein
LTNCSKRTWVGSNDRGEDTKQFSRAATLRPKAGLAGAMDQPPPARPAMTPDPVARQLGDLTLES